MSRSRYRKTLEVIDHWFAGAIAENHGIVPCRSGCSRCCYGPFDISLADALLVRDAVADLPRDIRARIHARALVQVEKMKALIPSLSVETELSSITEAEFDILGEALADEPCPLLDEDGSCLIYPNRPFICRMMGLGVRTPGGRVIDNSCPVQQDFPAYHALPHQLLDLESIEAEEAESLLTASTQLFGDALHAELETTIAMCLVSGKR